MTINRAMPTGAGSFLVTVQHHSANGTLRGCVKSPALGCKAPFTSLSRMVIMIEEWLDISGPAPPCKPDAAETADFEIEIFFRQNYSWQGKLHCLRTGHEAVFQSVLELLIQLEAALA